MRRVRACFGYTFGTKGDTGEDLDQTDLTKEHQEEFMVWDFTDCEHSTSSNKLFFRRFGGDRKDIIEYTTHDDMEEVKGTY